MNKGEFIEKKKILLLTLGTGTISENGEAGYRSVQYTIEGVDYRRNKEDTEGTKTNFVAEPIIDYCEPDDIFILGTVKSGWHQFYASAITENNEDLSYMDDKGYVQLLEIEKNHGIKTSGKDLEKLGQKISEIFSGIDTWKKYSKKYETVKPSVHILLTRYGINAEELKDNYNILKRIENSLDEKYEYEVTFDITHSFRSLPIYNLVILNYIKNITKYHLSIKHIYYGNLEASRELNGKAPIVDLYDLAHILDLTNGVAEFKDTGNSVSLIPLIDENDPLKEVLGEFDLAMQLNAFDKIKCELGKLCKLIQGTSEDSRYTGVREMIRTVLGEKFFDGKENGIMDLKQISEVDLKFQLTKWFFKQNRKGLGLATGLEALRDITTPAFVKKRNLSNVNERQHRENAEAHFVRIAEALEKKPIEDQSLMEKCVCKLGCKLKHYKDIRNTFAHSLGETKDLEIGNVREDIEQFEQDLFNLKKVYDENQNEFEELFKIRQGSSQIAKTSSACRVMIDFTDECDCQLYKTSTSGINYDVFFLESMVRSKFIGGFSGKNYTTTEKAYFLVKYLERHIPLGYDKVFIVLGECPNEIKEREMIFRAFIENMETSGYEVYVHHMEGKSIRPCKKLGLHIEMERYSNKFKDSDVGYATVMDSPLKQA